MINMGPIGEGKFFADVDLNNDGVLTKKELGKNLSSKYIAKHHKSVNIFDAIDIHYGITDVNGKKLDHTQEAELTAELEKKIAAMVNAEQAVGTNTRGTSFAFPMTYGMSSGQEFPFNTPQTDTPSIFTIPSQQPLFNRLSKPSPDDSDSTESIENKKTEAK